MDHVRAALLFQRGCEGGVAEACWRTALAHDEGRGVPTDRVKAARYRELACENGYPPACVANALDSFGVKFDIQRR